MKSIRGGRLTQLLGIVGLAWYALVLGTGPLGAGAVFASALLPVSIAGFHPRSAAALLSRGRRAPLWGGQAVMALGGTLDYLISNVFNYPTLAECYKVAALDGYNKIQDLDAISPKASVEVDQPKP